MRIERWFWLPVFCVVSILMHLTIAVVTRGATNRPTEPESSSIEVAFEPSAQPALPKPEPKRAATKPPSRHSVAVGRRPIAVAAFQVATIRRVAFEPQSIQRTVAGTNPLPTTVRPKRTSVELPERVAAEAPAASPLPERTLAAPLRMRIARNNHPLVEGGGAPSPAPSPGGHDGLAAPESPKEDVLYTGGGRGGENLPIVAPRIGGGGGRSILSVNGDNPLGDGIPDDKPGIGPGTRGGLGTGSKGGIGSGTGKGIGAQADGTVAIGSLRRARGGGIGAADEGTEIGTRAPGGGRGRGAELPGIGGNGNGYGRGHGNAIGEGADDAAPPGRMRGVPFGNIAGLLGGGDNAGTRDGALGRGAVFGTHRAGGEDGPIHIVYALDVSGSMRDGNKLGKAKEALKKALGELRRSDTFNIVVFWRHARCFSDDSVPATLANVANARAWVEDRNVADGTNISGALDLAFDMNGITHIFLMSDGEPNRDPVVDNNLNGMVGDFMTLRNYIREKNTHGIKITTLALGLGERFPGMRLLKGIAEDNGGTYDYINLAKIANPSH